MKFRLIHQLLYIIWLKKQCEKKINVVHRILEIIYYNIRKYNIQKKTKCIMEKIMGEELKH